MAKLPDHPLWLVWHPHQKLWNWRLVHGIGRLPLGSVLVGLVVWLDSVLLGLRVWGRRLRLLGLGAFRSRPLGRLTVLYVDCGVHRRGQELRFVSEQLGDNYPGLSPSCMITILRMNIEGAEHFVIEDLVESGQAGDIDGYHGMWDDLSKIDPEQDRTFRRLLRDNHIHPITFNARDLQHRMRRRSIVRDLDTTIRFGAGRKPGG